ncbi:hypothetical protein GJ744_008223 [Endocarpon pusillum]|uniref:Uncharacterized protein n=1 Tax=Endocarpon pusillum TaxID=364733 RepID=A0A8H7E0M8_9EURO|nr:hypothetical protein GJ744_008223 [Endocarpon pusillum]
MVVEEADLRDREVIQHHLAVLARPNIMQQLFYYSKALISVNLFLNARESVMLLFNPFLANEEIASQRYPVVKAAFVKAAAIQFTRGSIKTYTELVEQFLFALDRHIRRVTAKFRV